MRVAEVSQMDIADVPDASYLEERAEPVLLTGVQKDWAAPARWTPEYFREVAGDVIAPVEFYPEGTYFGRWNRVEMRMHRYLDLISGEDPERCYLAQVPLVDLFPMLTGDLSVPEFLHPVRGVGLALFVGNDSFTALHYHSGSQALLCGVGGTKRVTLFPPGDHRYLDFEHFFSYRFNFSRLPIGPENHGGKPPPEQTHPHTCEVGPDEALFIPLHWGHLVEGPGPTTSVTFFWDANVSGWRQPRVKGLSTLGGLTRRLIANPAVRLLEATVGLPD